jgi:hypothetical protein
MRIGDEAVQLWDGRIYCHDCVRKASPQLCALALSGEALRDVVEPRHVTAWQFIRRFGMWYSITVLVMLGIPLGLAAALGNVPIEGFLLALGFFGGFGLLFLSAQGLLGAFTHRRGLPREVSVVGGTVMIKSPNKVETVPLEKCRWSFGHTAGDPLCMFTGLRQGIVLQTPEAQLAIGHEEASLENWKSFLQLCRLPQARQVGCLWWLGMTVLGLAAGVGAGWCLGQIGARLLNNPLMEWTLPILGGIDGIVSALLYLGCKSDGAKAARNRVNPILIGLTFMVLGLKVGIGGNWPTALVGSVLNGILGFVVGWNCQLQIRAAEMEDELKQVTQSVGHSNASRDQVPNGKTSHRATT